MDAPRDDSSNLFPDENIVREEVTVKKQGKHKHVVYSQEDSDQLHELLRNPMLQTLMPKNVKGRRNRMLVWCVKELIRRLENPDLKGQQTVLDFASAEVEELRQEVSRLQQATNTINDFIESMKTKKNKWWVNLLC